MTSSGWSWILRDDAARRTKTSHRNGYDGIYLAACPACGQDCPWNAFDANPLCECTSSATAP